MAVHRGGFRAAPVFRGGGMRYGYRHAYHRPHFYHRHHFHRRFYAPRYYGYPDYYGYRHRYCRVIWTYYGPRKICRYRPWHRHHWRVRHYGPIAIGETRNETGARSGACFLQCDERWLDQSQSLPRQGLIFHGVSASIRHCSQCSGGQWLRREVSLGAVGRSTMRGMDRRYDWASPR